MNLPKNLSIYWTLSTTLAFWFLFVHAPPILIQRKVWTDPAFAIHIVGVYTVYLGCVVNALWTPSTQTGQYHVRIGRVALVAGIAGVISGAYKAWIPFGAYPIGGAVALSIGGSFQLLAEWFGYFGIKEYQRCKARIEELEGNDIVGDDDRLALLEELHGKKAKALQTHISSMVALFVAACGIPAAVRVAAVFGKNELVALIVCIVALNLMVNPYTRSYSSSKAAPSGEEQTLLDHAPVETSI